MYIRNKRGQSTVEYVLLVTAVIAVIIAVLTGNNNGVRGQINQTYNAALEQIDNMSSRLTGSEPQGAAADGGNGATPYTVNVAP